MEIYRYISFERQIIEKPYSCSLFCKNRAAFLLISQIKRIRRFESKKRVPTKQAGNTKSFFCFFRQAENTIEQVGDEKTEPAHLHKTNVLQSEQQRSTKRQRTQRRSGTTETVIDCTGHLGGYTSPYRQLYKMQILYNSGK